MEQVPARFSLVEDEFAAIFDRRYGPIETVHCEDADIIMITTGTVTSTCRQVIEELRAKGEKVGLLKLKMIRPFPAAHIRRALENAPKAAVIDRNFSFGASGIFAQEIRAALCDAPRHASIYNYITGLGGRDVTPQLLEEIYWSTKNNPTPAEESEWVGLNQEFLES